MCASKAFSWAVLSIKTQAEVAGISRCLQHYTRSHIQFPAGEIALSQSIVELVNRHILLAALNAIGGRIVGPGEM